MTGIGTLGEGPLHAALKEAYRRPGDLVEVEVEGFVADLVRGDELVEIQTGGFSAMRHKLDSLLDRHPLRLVHPIAAETWIRRVDDDGVELSRRRSPRRGIAADVCSELASFPTLTSHPHFTLEILLVGVEEVRRPDPSAWRRKGWRVAERRLVDIVERVVLESSADLLALLPPDLPERFTTAHLANRLGRPRRLARAVAYCLRETEMIEAVGRTREGIEYQRTALTPATARRGRRRAPVRRAAPRP